jgi:hypothetical protein
VKKTLIPSTDPGRFNLQIDGTTHASSVGDGGGTPVVDVTSGMHSVGETACDCTTSLSDYTSSIDCTNGNMGEGSGPLAVNVASGESVVCTITNTRRTGQVTVDKTLVPKTDLGRFDLKIDGTTYATAVGDGGTTNPVTLPTGSHSVEEAAHPGTTLGNYSTTYSCTNGASGAGPGPFNVAVTSGSSTTCTFTNTFSPSSPSPGP